MNEMNAWVKAQSDLFFAEYVWLAGNKPWSDIIRNKAHGQLDLLHDLFPSVPSELKVKARDFIEAALMLYYQKNFGLPEMHENYVDDDGYVWPDNEVYTTPF